MLSIDQAMEFGRALERLRHSEGRLDHLEDGLAEVRKEISRARGYINRGGLLVALWTGGTLTNVATDSGAEFLRSLIKTFFRT
jgi:hypothetical protein